MFKIKELLEIFECLTALFYISDSNFSKFKILYFLLLFSIIPSLQSLEISVDKEGLSAFKKADKSVLEYSISNCNLP